MKHILEALTQPNTVVYVELPDAAAAKRFQAEAAAAGFTFGDGVSPAAREMARVMAVHADGTICYPGVVGMTAFGSGAKTIGGKKLVRAVFSEREEDG